MEDMSGRREEEGSPLCCCEYRLEDGTVGHILDLCCDCEDFDRMVDGLVSGESLDQRRMEGFLALAEQRLRVPWRGGALRLPMEKVLPVIFIPMSVWLSSLHPAVMAGLLFTLPAILYFSARCVLRYRPKSKIFLYLSYTLSLTLIYIYEVKLIGLFWDLPKLVSPVENLVLVSGGCLSLYLYIRLKREGRRRKISGEEGGRYCRICDYMIFKKDHHCVWLDVCISQSNITTFTFFLFIVSITLLYLALIMSSAVCPGTLAGFGLVVVPGLCWPDGQTNRTILVGAIYAGVLCVLLFSMFLVQLYKRCRQSRRRS